MRSPSPATSPTRAPPSWRRRRERVPRERLLVETDAPYLTPQAVRKQRNQPAFVAHTAAFLAELRGVRRRRSSTRRVERNAARVFGWQPERAAGERGDRRPVAAQPAAHARFACAPTAISARTS